MVYPSRQKLSSVRKSAANLMIPLKQPNSKSAWQIQVCSHKTGSFTAKCQVYISFDRVSGQTFEIGGGVGILANGMAIWDAIPDQRLAELTDGDRSLDEMLASADKDPAGIMDDAV